MMKKSLLLTFLLLNAVFGGAVWGQTPSWSDNFNENDFDAQGWTKYNCNTNSTIVIASPSGYWFSFRSDTRLYSQYLITPEFSPANNVDVSFYYSFDMTNNSSKQASFKVGYSTSVSFNVDSFVWTEAINANSQSETYNQSFHSLTEPIRYIAIAYITSGSFSPDGHLRVDNFSIVGTEKVSCSVPRNIVLSNLTTNSVDLSWVSDASSFNVRYKKNGDASYTTIENVGGSPYTLVVNEDGNYVVSLQAVCDGSNGSSEWSTDLGFYTDCGNTDKCSISYELDDSDDWGGASIKVLDHETGYKLAVWEYDGTESTADGTLYVCNGRRIDFVWIKGGYNGYFDDECSFVIYDPSGVEIISVDDASDIDETPFATYTMNCPSCERPQNIAVANITKNSADISWSGSNDSYTVEKRALNELSIQRFENTADISEWQMVNKSQNYMGVYKSVEGEKLARTGNKGFLFASFDYADDPNQFLVSPVINDLGTTVAFYYKNVNGMETEVFRVGYSTKENPDVDNDDDWNWDSSINVPENDTEWHLYTRELPAGTKHVAINYMSDYLYYLAVDDFGIYNGTWAEVDEVNEEEINLVNLESNVLYSVRVQGNCTSETSDYSDIISFTTPIVFTENGHWDETAKWSTGTTPSIYDYNVVINASVTIPDNITATAANITLDGGSITIEDGGQLICNNSVAATVKMNIEGSTATKSSTESWYTISSPVHDGTANTLNVDHVTNLVSGSSGFAYDMFRYNESTATWENQKSSGTGFNVMNNGRGYIYRNSGEELAFAGNTNVNDMACPLSFASTNEDLKGFNLIGNPYTHSIAKGSGKAIDNDNLTAGYYILSADGGWQAKEDGTEIPAKQGILVKTSAADDDFTIKDINYVAPSSKANGDNICFTIENSGYSDVSYALFDKGLGLNKIEHRNANIPMLYIDQNDVHYAIATMADDTKSFNLSLNAKTFGKYTLNAKANGNFSYLHVIDRLTGEDVDMLLEGEYSFIASPIDSENRFIVRLEYSAGSEISESSIFAYQSGNDIIVNGEGELQVFDVMGRMIATHRINGVETINLQSHGVYIFKLNEKTQKIVVK